MSDFTCQYVPLDACLRFARSSMFVAQKVASKKLSQVLSTVLIIVESHKNELGVVFSYGYIYWYIIHSIYQIYVKNKLNVCKRRAEIALTVGLGFRN
jgi:hypothetical protein